MMSTLEHPLVVDYLSRLEAAASTLTPDRRAELITDIGEHIEEAIAHTDGSDGAVRDVLERLGPPEDVAGEAGSTPTSGSGTPVLEMFSFGFLVAGALLAITLWLAFVSPIFTIIGLLLAVFSRRWGWQEKALAFVAYGLFGPMPLIALNMVPYWVETCTQTGDSTGATSQVCTGGPPDWWPWFIWPALIGIVCLWIYTGVRLYRRAHR